MVAGGLALRRARYAEFESAAQDIKRVHGITREMKWSEYKGGAKRAPYEAMVELLFAWADSHHAAYHCLIAKFDEFTHRLDPGDSEDTSVNRMYFQLLQHRVCRFYGRKCSIAVFPDVGNDSSDIPLLRNELCAAAYKRYRARPNCVREIAPQHSHHHNVLQAVDIVTGAIAAKCNARAGGHKAELAEYVLNRSGRRTWLANTAWTERKFTVWNFRQSKNPRDPRPSPR